MGKIKKTIITTCYSLCILTGNLSIVHAQNVNYKIPNPSKYGSLEEVISAVASLIRPVFIITFGAMILFAAWNILVARGSDEKVATGKKTLTAAIVGFAISVLAPTIANVVTSLIGVQGFKFS